MHSFKVDKNRIGGLREGSSLGEVERGEVGKEWVAVPVRSGWSDVNGSDRSFGVKQNLGEEDKHEQANCAGDAVDDVGLHAQKDFTSLDQSKDDDSKTLRKENNVCGRTETSRNQAEAIGRTK